jgi:hypothetical protein
MHSVTDAGRRDNIEGERKEKMALPQFSVREWTRTSGLMVAYGKFAALPRSKDGWKVMMRWIDDTSWALLLRGELTGFRECVKEGRLSNIWKTCNQGENIYWIERWRKQTYDTDLKIVTWPPQQNFLFLSSRLLGWHPFLDV